MRDEASEAIDIEALAQFKKSNAVSAESYVSKDEVTARGEKTIEALRSGSGKGSEELLASSPEPSIPVPVAVAMALPSGRGTGPALSSADKNKKYLEKIEMLKKKADARGGASGGKHQFAIKAGLTKLGVKHTLDYLHARGIPYGIVVDDAESVQSADGTIVSPRVLLEEVNSIIESPCPSHLVKVCSSSSSLTESIKSITSDMGVNNPPQVVVVSMERRQVVDSHNKGFQTIYLSPTDDGSSGPERKSASGTAAKPLLSLRSLFGRKEAVAKEVQHVSETSSRTVRTLFGVRDVVEELNGPAYRISSR